MFQKVEHRERFKSAIRPGSILWQLKSKEYAIKRQNILKERGQLLDIPQWRGTLDGD